MTDETLKVREMVETYFDQHARTYIVNQDVIDWERDHIVNIGTSIMCTKWEIGPHGGGFVQAVVDNNLERAVGRADKVNLQVLPFYVYMMNNLGYMSLT